MIEYRNLRIALLGAGSVGAQVADQILRHGDELAAVQGLDVRHDDALPGFDAAGHFDSVAEPLAKLRAMGVKVGYARGDVGSAEGRAAIVKATKEQIGEAGIDPVQEKLLVEMVEKQGRLANFLMERALGISILRWPDMDLKDDLEGLLGLMHHLDLVITPSTAVLGFAGAAGRPTVYLGHQNWLLLGERERYPWYASVHPAVVPPTHAVASAIPEARRRMDAILG